MGQIAGPVVRGMFVQNPSKNCGVISSVSQSGNYVYVEWFMSYDSFAGEVNSFQEYVSVDHLETLPPSDCYLPGLQALKRKVIR